MHRYVHATAMFLIFVSLRSENMCFKDCARPSGPEERHSTWATQSQSKATNFPRPKGQHGLKGRTNNKSLTHNFI